MIIKEVAIKNAQHENLRNLTHYLMKGKDGNAIKHARVREEFTINTIAETPEMAISEMQLTAAQNERIKTSKFTHLILSLRSGEHLSKEKWQEITTNLLNNLDLANHQAFAVVHCDTDNEHCHLVINRINPQTGNANVLSFLHRKLQTISENFEKNYNLQNDNHATIYSKAERNAINIEHKSGQQTFFSYLLPLKDQLLQSTDWQDFHNILAAHGVQAKHTGRGLVFKTTIDHEEFTLKASSLNRELSLNKCEQRLGKFEQAELETAQIPQEKFTQQPVTFNSKDDLAKLKKEQLFVIYNKNQKHNQEVKAFLISELKKDKRDKLNNLFKLKQQYNRALNTVYYRQPKKKADEKEVLDKLYEQQRQKILNDFNNTLTTINKQYPKQTFIDWLKSYQQNDLSQTDSRELLLSRDGAKNQSSINQIYSQMYLEITQITELQFFKLYKRTNKGQDIFVSPFTSDLIRDDGNKLVLNDKPSLLTVAEALKIAQQRYQSPLIINGTNNFQRQCASIAAQLHIAIICTDPKCQNFYTKLEEKNYERSRQVLTKYQLREPTSSRATSIYQAETFYTITRRTYQSGFRSQRNQIPRDLETQSRETSQKTPSREHLPQMSMGNMDAMAARNQNLLHSNAPSSMGEQRFSKLSDRMRWQISGERTKSGGERITEDPNKDPVQAYINERNLKRKTIKDIKQHRLFTKQTGKFFFRGLRKLGSNDYALIEQDNIVYVKELNEYGKRRLEKLKRNQTVTVRTDGVLEVKTSRRK